jgi:hypothetical protein
MGRNRTEEGKEELKKHGFDGSLAHFWKFLSILI